MKKSMIVLAAVVAALVLAGCVRKDAIVFHGIEDVNVSMGSSPRIGVVLAVENTSGRDITFRDASFSVEGKEGSVLGKVTVEKELFIPKRSRVELYVPLKVSIDNPLQGIALLGDLFGKAPSHFVSGSVKVKAGCIRRKITVDRVPLSDFIKYFGQEAPSAKGVSSGSMQAAAL